MRTFAGMGLALAAEVTATGALATAWRLRARRGQRETPLFEPSAAPLRLDRASTPESEISQVADRADGPENQGSEETVPEGSKPPIPDHVSAVVEIEPVDAVLPPVDPPPPIPPELLTELRADPLLGLADVRLVQHVQRTGAGLPDRSQAGGSYQGLNHDVARRLGTDPIPAVRLTWLALRLELPGSRRQALATRAAGPILARGGGITGAARTLDKAARTAAARLALAGYRTVTLAEDDYGPGFSSGLAETHDSPAIYAAAATDTDADAATRPAQNTVNATLAAATATTTGTTTTPTATATATAEHVTAALGGVLIGVDPAHRPVTLGLFRRTTLSTAVVGSLYLAQILALRCAAVGARVIVETARQDEWDPVLLHSGLDRTRLAVQPVGRPVGHRGWPAPSMANPLLVLRDCGARPPYTAMPHGPWTAIVTLLPYFDPRTAGYLRDADLVGLQRMPREEAAMARHLLSLPDQDMAALADLPEPMVLWRSRRRTMRYCELAPTSWEEAFLGEPMR